MGLGLSYASSEELNLHLNKDRYGLDNARGFGNGLFIEREEGKTLVKVLLV